MTNDVKNVPEWRFAGFVDEWKKKLLNEIANVQMGQSPNSKNYTDDSQEMILVQGNADLKNGKVFPRIFTKEITKLANIGDILLSVRAPVGEIGISQMPVCIGRGVCSITSNLFIYYFLDYFNNENKWKKFSQGSTFESISGNEVRSLIIYSPSKTEQQKIGDFFSKLDRQIELEEQKLEKLEEQKKGYMQQIFSQKLRFKDENGSDYPEWKKEIIGNIATTFSGGTPSSTNSTFYTGEIPFIRSGEISKTSTELMINEKAISNSSAKMVETGDLLYALYGATSGEVAISKINGAINQAVLCIRSQESIAYIFNYLKMKKDQILKTYIQGGQGNLSASIIKKVDIDLPNLEEQKLIGHFFNKFDDYIEIQSDKVELLKERKKGFLQKMFV
ncbi:restriction endonuclease subunit S [Staphylococcus carnosus]|uniref:restriction endonuclease subunit S n=1 Tax=Staphylococcus carnosus TaxID=1281 RepID=UPI0020A4A683|nr:restriction endonuclease subunit S [Staphylococcus carnosus]UTB79440.1 hypothetical protein A2I65_00245 [Staphylococcus carnosus]